MKLQLTALLVACLVVCCVVCVADTNDSWSGHEAPYGREYRFQEQQYPGVQGKIITTGGSPNQYPVNNIGEPPARPGSIRPSYPSYPFPVGNPPPQRYPSQQDYPSPTRQGYPQGYPPPQQLPPGGFERLLSAIALIADALERLEERVQALEFMRGDVDAMKEQLRDLTHNDLSTSESSHINRFGIASSNDSRSDPGGNKLTPKPTAITPAAPDTTKSCPPKFERIGQDCFYISVRNYQMLTWQGAQAVCSALGGRLAAPDTRAKIRELNEVLTNSSSTAGYNFWLGGLYPGISWRWVFSGEEVIQEKDLWTFSSTYENAQSRQATFFEHQPELFSIRQKLLEAGRPNDDLVKLMENITAAVGEDKVAEFVASDPALQNVGLDLDIHPEDNLPRSIKRIDETWETDSSQHPAESRIHVSPLKNFLNPLLSFFNVGAPKKGPLSSMMDSFRYVMGQTREPKAKPLDETSTRPEPARPSSSTSSLTNTALSSGSPKRVPSTLSSTDPTSFDGASKSASGTSVATGRNHPWDKNLGRCLLFQPVLEGEKRFFKYAADQCGYRRYFICQKS